MADLTSIRANGISSDGSLRIFPGYRVEHRFHALSCERCGAVTRGWDEEVLFVTTEGVEPTNNSAERALHPVVLWHKLSFGSQSAQGSLFVARMMTAVSSLKAQQRPVLDFLSQAILAARSALSSPSLLPKPASTP